MTAPPVFPGSLGQFIRTERQWRTFGVLVGVFVVATSLSCAALSIAWPRVPVVVNVRWRPDVAEARRVGLERQFRLTQGEPTEGTTWTYQLTDSSSANISALIRSEAVDDTAHLDRTRYRPDFEQDRSLQIAVYSAAMGGVGVVVFLLLASIRRRIRSVAPSHPPEGAGAAPLSATGAGASGLLIDAPEEPRGDSARSSISALPNHSRRATAAGVLLAALVSVAMSVLAGAHPLRVASALLVVYVGGYIAGALLVTPVDERLGVPLAIIRTLAGLLLTTSGFLLALVLSLPWFVGPGVLVAAAIALRRRAAFAWPHAVFRFRWDAVAAGALALILLSPSWISYAYMAPGSFPAVFYKVDTAYGLEKVHALVAADSYPPPSLGNVGISRTYHYGSFAMAALISRSSGLLPHHALFLIVLPLLTLGVMAAAFAVVRLVGPVLPRSVAVPLLMLSAPSLYVPFWDTFGPQVWAAISPRGLSIDQLIGDMSIWGVLSNEGATVGGDFLVLGSIAAIAATPVWGSTLPAFLIGSTILVKSTAGVALVSGFALAEGWRIVAATRPWPSRLALMAAAVFIAQTVAFFMISFEGSFRLEPSLFNHLRQVSPGGVVLDVLWLLLPALIVLLGGISDPERRSAPFLLMAIAPLVVVNVSRLNNTQVGGGGTGSDWLQMLTVVPLVLHAFVLSVAARRWSRIGRPRRAAFIVASVLAIAPVALAAGRYSSALLRDPASGHEFVDNRALASALAVIPTSGTLLVTNDLRYPAGNFAREDRQMQIPALFGHQAFAVNYVYEAVEERRELQHLLTQPEWSDAILDAARAYHWTHLVIHKDYDHPTRIPLERLFENQMYAVFSFP